MKLKYNDEKHAYWLDGKRTKSVTGLAKMLDDTFALDGWKLRQMVVGMATDPTLVDYARKNVEDREAIETVVSAAFKSAKSFEAAERGTAMHATTERVDLGLDPGDTQLDIDISEAWPKAIDDAGYDLLDDYIERLIVYPEIPVCGRWDRLLRRRKDGKLIIADLKTGEKAVKYPHGMAIQLAMYANAPFLSGPLDAEGRTEVFDLPPKIDKKIGLIVHMPTPERVECLEIDIAAGWKEVKDRVLPILEWRKRSDLLRSVSVTELATPGVFVRHLIDRCVWAQEHDQTFRDRLKKMWPKDLPTLKAGGLTYTQCERAEAVIVALEQELDVPFGPTGPNRPWREERSAQAA